MLKIFAFTAQSLQGSDPRTVQARDKIHKYAHMLHFMCEIGSADEMKLITTVLNQIAESKLSLPDIKVTKLNYTTVIPVLAIFREDIIGHTFTLTSELGLDIALTAIAMATIYEYLYSRPLNYNEFCELLRGQIMDNMQRVYNAISEHMDKSAAQDIYSIHLSSTKNIINNFLDRNREPDALLAIAANDHTLPIVYMLYVIKMLIKMRSLKDALIKEPKDRLYSSTVLNVTMASLHGLILIGHPTGVESYKKQLQEVDQALIAVLQC